MRRGFAEARHPKRSAARRSPIWLASAESWASLRSGGRPIVAILAAPAEVRTFLGRRPLSDARVLESVSDAYRGHSVAIGHHEPVVDDWDEELDAIMELL